MKKHENQVKQGSRLTAILALLCIVGLLGCETTSKQKNYESMQEITDEDLDRLGITNRDKLSAASKRA